MERNGVVMAATHGAVSAPVGLLAEVDSVHDAVDVLVNRLRVHRRWTLDRVSAEVRKVLEQRPDLGVAEPGWRDPLIDGLSRWRWQRYRNGSTKCHPAVVRALAVVCGVSSDDWAKVNDLLAGARAGGTARRASADEARALVRRLSAHAVREVAARRGADTARLDRLYIERTDERGVLEELLAGSSGCVTGDAGTGKTSLLWSLARQLARAGRAATLLRAGDLVPGRSRLTPDMLSLALTASSRTRPVLLIDSVDLLLHGVDGRAVLTDVIAVANERRVPVALSCRSTELFALEDIWETPSLRRWHLGDYDERELREAVAALSLAYYRGHPELDHRQVYDTVVQAVVDGLPIREVCQRPLTLRMLFEVAGDGVPDVEVDADELMELYWGHRVWRDDRLGVARDESAAGSGVDCGPVAEAIAEVMLAEGDPELTMHGLRRVRVAEDGNPESVEQAVRLLRTRGVLVKGGRYDPIKFFHQVFFEYAGGRRLVGMSGDGVGALLDLLEGQSGDAYRIAVAEQALVQSGRSPEDPGNVRTVHLPRLLRHREHALLALGLRVYARLPDPDPRLRADADQTLGTCSAAMAVRYLGALPATRHTVTGERSTRLAGELRLLWNRGDPGVRRVVIQVLLRLAGRIPLTVMEFLEATCRDPVTCAETPCGSPDCLWSWLTTVPSEQMRLDGNPAAHLLEALAPTDPHKVWIRLRNYCTSAMRARRPAIVARCLRLAGTRYDEFGLAAIRELARDVEEQRPDSGPRAGDRDWLDVEQALAVLLARRWQAEGIADQRTLSDVVLARSGPNRMSPARRVAALAVGECARVLPEQDVIRFLDSIAAGLHQDSISMLLAKVVLRPLLLRDPNGPPLAWTAAKLRALSDDRPDERAILVATFARVAIDHKSVPNQLVAALVRAAWPRRLRSMTDERFWFDPSRAGGFTVQAAAGGHRSAALALSRRRAARASGTGTRSRADSIIDRRCRRVAKDDFGFLHNLLTAGIAVDDVRWLARLVDNDLFVTGAGEGPSDDGAEPGLIDQRALAVFRDHADRIAAVIAAALDVRGDRELCSAALRLWTFLVRHRIGPAPSGPFLAGKMLDTNDPQLAAGLLRLAQAVLDRPLAVPWTYDGGQLIEEATDRLLTLARAATAEEPETIQGERLAQQWRAIERACRRCAITVTARLSPLDTAAQRAAAVRRMREQLAEVTEVDDLVRARGLIEALTSLDPSAAVDLFVFVVERTEFAQGYESHAVSRLGYRWWQMIDRLIAATPHAEWDAILTQLRDGPWELFHVLLKISARVRPEDVSADLWRHARASRHRHLAESAVEQHTRLHRRERGAGTRWPQLYDIPIRPNQHL